MKKLLFGVKTPPARFQIGVGMAWAMKKLLFSV